jgi:magnesium transporter
MNIASPPVSATAVSSEGIVRASVYVDGRRVANIAIDEASSWRSRPGQCSEASCHSCG